VAASTGRENQKPCSSSQPVAQQLVALHGGLDSLGDHSQSELVGHLDDCLDDSAAARLRTKVADKRAIQLDATHGKSAKGSEVGVASAEVGCAKRQQRA
jgi:hypothetical protein